MRATTVLCQERVALLLPELSAFRSLPGSYAMWYFLYVSPALAVARGLSARNGEGGGSGGTGRREVQRSTGRGTGHSCAVAVAVAVAVLTCPRLEQLQQRGRDALPAKLGVAR
jgi:hypothetical protein